LCISYESKDALWDKFRLRHNGEGSGSGLVEEDQPVRLSRGGPLAAHRFDAGPILFARQQGFLKRQPLRMSQRESEAAPPSRRRRR
jgi:hypothetical protein